MNSVVAEAMRRMLSYPGQTQHDIDHFMKVYAYAETIGVLEGLDPETQEILEIASILHDIACPLCRKKYGNTNGVHQQDEGMPLAKAFLTDTDVSSDARERIVWLIGHHHTYSHVEGMDYQILLEADYLVNATENEKYRKQIDAFRKNVFKTVSGFEMLDALI